MLLSWEKCVFARSSAPEWPESCCFSILFRTVPSYSLPFQSLEGGILNLLKTLHRPLPQLRRVIVQLLRMLVDLQLILLPLSFSPFPLHDILP